MHCFHDCCELPEQATVQKIPNPRPLYQALYRHFLSLGDGSLCVEGAGLGGPGLSSLSPALLGDPDADRQLCVRALTALYSHHASQIGTAPAVINPSFFACHPFPLSL